MSRALESTEEMLALIVDRSQPVPNKPTPGGPAAEAVLRDLDRRNAQCYADLELKSHRLRRLALAIDRCPSHESDLDAVPLPADEDDPSLVYHLEKLRGGVS